ncbi:MAG: hypothetical protein LAT57_02535, partial [Balneolales bacterium]|nr:hypothetical protein [Balneolales bacterium]
MNYLSPVCARFASAYAVLLSAIDKLVGKPVLLFVSVWAVLLSVIDKLVGKPVMLFASVWVALLVVVLAPIPSVAFQVEEPETTDNGDLNHLRPEFFDTLRIDLTITTNADIIVRLRQYHPSANDRRTFFIPTHDPNGDINIRDVRVVIDDVPLTEVDNYDAQNNTFKVAGHGGLAIWPPRLWRDYPIDIGYTLSNAIVTDGTWAHAEGHTIGWTREYDGFIADIRVRYERSQNPERIHFIAQDGQIIGSNSRSEVGVATDGQVRFLMQTSIGSGVIHLVFPAQYIQSGAERTRFSRSPEEVLSRVEAAIEEEARQQAEVAERRQSGRTFGGFLFLLSLALS